jgi:hypothetical protein
MIVEDLSWVDECVTHSIHKLGLAYERCVGKGEISTKFVPSSASKDEEETLKAPQIPYPPNPKPSFNPNRGVKKETPKPREEAFVCMFCGRAGHLDEFCFLHKKIEKRRLDYARNTYRHEFIDFPSCSYSRASPRTSFCVLSHFPYGPNHLSYGFGPQENNFATRRFGYSPRPYRGDRFPCRHGFPAGKSYPHFEPKYLDGPHFPHHGFCSTG